MGWLKLGRQILEYVLTLATYVREVMLDLFESWSLLHEGSSSFSTSSDVWYPQTLQSLYCRLYCTLYFQHVHVPAPAWPVHVISNYTVHSYRVRLLCVSIKCFPARFALSWRIWKSKCPWDRGRATPSSKCNESPEASSEGTRIVFGEPMRGRKHPGSFSNISAKTALPHFPLRSAVTTQTKVR